MMHRRVVHAVARRALSNASSILTKSSCAPIAALSNEVWNVQSNSHCELLLSTTTTVRSFRSKSLAAMPVRVVEVSLSDFYDNSVQTLRRKIMKRSKVGKI